MAAEAKLPIRNIETLRYGSQNAGAPEHLRVVRFNKEIHAEMKIMAKKLNLKEHGVLSSSGIVTLFTPIDLEVHECDDRRWYCVDVSRLFPPEFRGKDGKVIVSDEIGRLAKGKSIDSSHGAPSGSTDEKKLGEATDEFDTVLEGGSQNEWESSIELSLSTSVSFLPKQTSSRLIRCETTCDAFEFTDHYTFHFPERSKAHTFYNLLRPELLLQSRDALCSDAQSSFLAAEERRDCFREVM